jgi:serine phosphatase RsbU (regulator of sigma subunit)/energy-coupling factor transporter ATP-binding protein EcfA2
MSSGPRSIDPLLLRRCLIDRLNREEFEILCSDLQGRLDGLMKGAAPRLGTDHLGGPGLQYETLVARLIEQLSRHRCFEVLRDLIADTRPDLANCLIQSGFESQPLNQPVECPYPGLLFFTEDGRFPFFGRDTEIGDGLTTLFRARFLAVIGRTGSGKSSLALAGILPKWRPAPRGNAEPVHVYVRPGAQPIAALTAARTQLEAVTAAKALLVIDQFEELLTHDRETQHACARRVEDVLADRRYSVLLTVRADFYPDLMELPLWPLVREHRLEVLPLSGDRLRAALVQPAAARGVTIDPVLVERLVKDAAAEPGSLPFVQLVMQELWDQRRDGIIPLEPYEQLGGLQAAAARCANDAYRDLEKTWARDERARGAALVRRIFVRLVDVARDGRETRRQQSISELRGDDASPMFSQVLTHFIDRRLLTSSSASGKDSDGDTERRIDLAHESLITAWSTLRDWLTEVRDVERRLRALAHRADAWHETHTNQPRRGLLDRYELAAAEQSLATGTALDLGPAETLRLFAEASRREVQRRDNEEDAARRRELELAQREADLQRQLAENRDRQLQDRMTRDLQIAAEIQQALLPKPDLDLGFVDASAASIPCRSIGGDFLDYVSDVDGGFGFTLGDVAGKGAPAALLSALMQGMFAMTELGEGPADAVTAINAALCHRGRESRFVTLMIGVLRPTGLLTYCNAGHNPPFIVGTRGIRRLDVGGPCVGLLEKAPFTQETEQLDAGDVVVIFSDGVSEGLNVSGDEFGDDRLQSLIERSHGADPRVLVERIVDAVRSFTAGAVQSDDISLMVVRYRGRQ